jgi:hypothetical protein
MGSDMPKENERYLKAKKKVKDIKDFYIHLAVFLIVLTIIILINVVTFATGRSDQGGWNLWFLFPFGFWGLAVLMHGLRTFVLGRESSWEKRKIKEVIKDMDQDN